MAQLAKSADVVSCKSLGGTVVDVAPTKSADERVAALREKAAQAGATHVIAETSTAGRVKGEMYACPDQSDTTSDNNRLQ